MKYIDLSLNFLFWPIFSLLLSHDSIRRKSNFRSGLQRIKMISKLSSFVASSGQKRNYIMYSCLLWEKKNKLGWPSPSVSLPRFPYSSHGSCSPTPLSEGESTSVLTWATITKYHRLVASPTEICFSEFWRVGSSRSMCWQSGFHSKVSPLGWQAAATSLCDHMTAALCMCTRQVWESGASSLVLWYFFL